MSWHSTFWTVNVTKESWNRITATSAEFFPFVMLSLNSYGQIHYTTHQTQYSKSSRNKWTLWITLYQLRECVENSVLCQKAYAQKQLCDWGKMGTASASYSGSHGFIIFTHRQDNLSEIFCNILNYPLPWGLAQISSLPLLSSCFPNTYSLTRSVETASQ
jgi:hypothetical protein